jgi:hypothetical protein
MLLPDNDRRDRVLKWSELIGSSCESSFAQGDVDHGDLLQRLGEESSVQLLLRPAFGRGNGWRHSLF